MRSGIKIIKIKCDTKHHLRVYGYLNRSFLSNDACTSLLKLTDDNIHYLARQEKDTTEVDA